MCKWALPSLEATPERQVGGDQQDDIAGTSRGHFDWSELAWMVAEQFEERESSPCHRYELHLQRAIQENRSRRSILHVSQLQDQK